jgi:hypothetical protein
MLSAALTMRKAASGAGRSEPAASGALDGGDGVADLDPMALETAWGAVTR